jgi:hypothetical protein
MECLLQDIFQEYSEAKRLIGLISEVNGDFLLLAVLFGIISTSGYVL